MLGGRMLEETRKMGKLSKNENGSSHYIRDAFVVNIDNKNAFLFCRDRKGKLSFCPVEYK